MIAQTVRKLFNIDDFFPSGANIILVGYSRYTDY